MKQPPPKITIILLVALIWLCGCKTTTPQTSKPPAKLVLKAANVEEAPTVDGVLDDKAWDKASSLKVETKGGPLALLRAVADDKKLFIQASWTDKSKNDMDTPWVFSGQGWKKDPGDDVIILVWNINDSLEGFNRKGAAIIKQTPRDFARVRGFVIEGEAPADGLWKGRNQKGDIWDLALGLTNPLGLANDLFLAVDPAYLSDPVNKQPKLTAQSDSYPNGTPWTRNIDESGIPQPKYRFASGRNPENTPMPTLAEMREIIPGDKIAAGEIAPYYIFEEGKNWGGSMDDVKGKGIWVSGEWKTEMSRKLVTGNADDVVFELKPGKNYFVFSLMIRDGDSDYYTSPPIALEIVK